jgi:Protein of unknown function (DUF3093)
VPPDALPPRADRPDYHERLHAPLRWWVQGTMLVASAWLAAAVALPAAGAFAVAAVGLVLMSAFLLSYGGARIEVGGGMLRAGPAGIETSLVGAATPLDAPGTRRQAGVDADARAYLLLRPFVKTSVRVEVTDPADPTPYWLLSSRRPEALASALDAATGRLAARHLTGED